MGRKSRIQTEDKKNAEGNRGWKIGIYIRLSKEDAGSGNESESVINQRKINLEFVEEKFRQELYEIVGTYVDDGHSGTTEDERPAFQRLCQDIEMRKINCVVCKTLSRAFRNYADQGKFLEQFLPAWNCRFITVGNPHIDTMEDPEYMQNMEIPINGLMNDRYAAKTSEDVRRTFRIKQSKGEFIGAFAPYGYLKKPENKNALVIDKEAAEVVRRIYELFLEGVSQSGIVRYLNEHGILCPALYKREKQGMKYQNPYFNPVEDPLWSYSTVHNILKNPVYCGDMVQGRSKVKSYKVHIQEPVPKEKWAVVKNTHEAIIQREIFNRVQELLKRDTRTSPRKNSLYLFSGFLRCADCGRAMVRSEVKGNVYYYCSTYKNRSKIACTKHTIRHNNLEEAVLTGINMQIHLRTDPAEIHRRLLKSPERSVKREILKEIIGQNKVEIDRIMGYRREIYQDWKDCTITREDFLQMREIYDGKIKSLEEKIRTCKEEMKKKENLENPADPYLHDLKKYGNIKRISRELLTEFVDFIEVYEKGNICINFRFSEGKELFCKKGAKSSY